MPPSIQKGSVSIYFLGGMLGIAAGFIDIKIGDVLFTALFVLASTMVLGMLRPQKPWRWTVLVAAFVPVMQLLAFLFLAQKPYRAQIYESFLGLLSGIAGAYGGMVAHRGWKELFGKGESSS
jgi:hypothetical protein